jgi:hypothetical protein
MIEAALKYIVGLKKPEIIGVNGQSYCDKDLKRIAYNPKTTAIGLSTLSSLIDYIKADIDTMADKMIIHVQSPVEVALYSQLDKDREREYMVVAKAKLPELKTGTWVGHEEFLIALQSVFVPSDSRDLLLKFAGTVESGSIAQYGDDGVSQKATIKKGITTVEEKLIPNPVKLRPYRTFLDVEQPESQFIFRMRDNERYGGVDCALYEADGGAWKINAMSSIKEHLQFELKEFEDKFIVIS